MYATETYDTNTTEKDSLSQRQWMNWCRLCAKEDNKNNKHFLYQKEEEHSEYGTKKSSIQEALSKYFWVQTSLDDSLPKVLCPNCLSLISSLINFDERVERVQIMYHYLNHFHTNNSDLNSVRLKYNVTEQERDEWFSNYSCTKEIYVDTTCKVLETPESLRLSEGDKHIIPESLQLSEIDDHLQVKNELENGVVLQESLEHKDHVETIDTDSVEKEDILCDDNNSNDFNQERDESPFECIETKEKTGNNSEEKSYTTVVLTDNDSYILKPRRNKKTNKSKKIKHRSSSQNKNKRQFIQDYEMEITCKECDVNFTKYVTYRDHLQQAHNQEMNNKQWPCPVCQLILSSSTNLRHHVVLHGPVEVSKPFKCPECDNRYTSNRDVQKHVRIVHRREKPYICEECGLRFADTSGLKNHILIHHTDLAPYECEVCKKRFKLLKRLKGHLDIHSPNKHICKICGLQLNSRDTLKRHKVVHSDKAHHKCDYCGKGFKRSNSLKDHLLRHTGLKPYSCDFCERTFGNRSSCRFHMRKSHPDELAAQDATGNKVHTKNVPKLEILKAVTKTADNLLPVRRFRSGCNIPGKKPKKLKKNDVKSSKPRQKSHKHHTTNKVDMPVSPSSTPLD